MHASQRKSSEAREGNKAQSKPNGTAETIVRMQHISSYRPTRDTHTRQFPLNVHNFPLDMRGMRHLGAAQDSKHRAAENEA